MPLSIRALLFVLLSALAAASASAQLSITSTTFGWDPVLQQPTAIGQSPISQYPAMAVNQELVIGFNGNVDKNSVNQITARIESVPASELNPLGLSSSLPGGLLAPVLYKVKNNKIIFQPAVLITNGQISFGFAPGAFYRLTLKGGKNGVKGSPGQMSNTIQIRFRTTDQVVDPQLGPPQPTVSIVDAQQGTKSLAKINLPNLDPTFANATVSPSPIIKIKFNELVKPTTVVDAVTGGSPSIRIEIDLDGLGATLTDRTTVPGTFTLTSTQKASTVTWKSLLDAVPGDAVYVVTIEPLVEDLVGNSIFGQTGDIGKKEVFAFKTKLTGPVVLDPILEPFTNQTKYDADSSSADWADSQPGFLITGAGGGTGEDGEFVAGGPLVVLPTSQTVGQNEVPRIYNYSTFVVPSNVTVRAEGPFPLNIRSTGPVSIAGILDVSGGTPDNAASTQTNPGLGGVARAGGGAGGLGGSVTFGSPDFVPTITNQGVPGYANSAQPNRGLVGQVATVTDFETTVTAAGAALTALQSGTNQSKIVGLWIQPNTGTGADASLFPNSTPGGAILHDHPTFKITSFGGLTGAIATFGVESGLSSPTYFGPLTQPGLDFYEFPPPPITRVGDPVVFGDLKGHDGDPSSFVASVGRGSLPLTVAQDFITQVRSGGGGGGGARLAGEDGEDSPSFGTATGTSGGAGGAAAISANVVSFTATTLTASGTPFTGLSLGAGVDPEAAPAAVVYPSITSAYVFEIVSNSPSVLTIKPIALLQDSPIDTNNDGTVDLFDIQGLAGGNTLRVEPSAKRGGAGGGGSGVHVANTAKSSPAPALNLPNFTPGMGGGAGGGSVIIESADRIGVASGGQIIARGGNGGRTTGVVLTSASGGGGGGGGTITLRSADNTPFAVTVTGLVDARGGDGGFGFVEGGGGGDGRIRFENLSGSLAPEFYQPNTILPGLTATDLGFMIPGLSSTVAVSKFFFSGALLVTYPDFVVTYEADVNGVHTTGLTFDRADLLASAEAPFEIKFNDAQILTNGQIDPSSIDLDFVSDPSTLNGSYIRFRIELESSKVIGGQTFENVKIDSVQLAITATS